RSGWGAGGGSGGGWGGGGGGGRGGGGRRREGGGGGEGEKGKGNRGRDGEREGAKGMESHPQVPRPSSPCLGAAAGFRGRRNRAGVALMEIVSKPDLRSSEDAKAYVAKLRTILRYLGTCDGDMEKGNLRADVNVSVRKPGAALGTRCEIKNVNSIRFIGQAIEYEARRQVEILEDGGRIEQETRLFDPGKGETRSMRNKEEAHD